MSFDEKLFKLKVTTFFKRLDADGNGLIEQDDLQKWADKLISFGNISADGEVVLKERMNLLWSEYFAPADADQSGSISSEEMVDHIKKSESDETKRDFLRNLLPLIFDAIDSDKSGSVSADEFANFFKSLNINDHAVAEQVFGSMDSNSDGTLSKEEFTKFGRSFFTCGESDPARLFFGPLED